MEGVTVFVCVCVPDVVSMGAGVVLVRTVLVSCDFLAAGSLSLSRSLSLSIPLSLYLPLSPSLSPPPLLY